MRGSEWPAYCYWSAAQIFRMAGDSRESSRTLDKARRLMMATARDLEPDDRERFLAIPWHADATRAAVSDAWPDPPR
jgi:hypothetical protein